MKNIIITLCLVLGILPTVGAQQPSLKDQIKTFKNNKKFAVEYDRFKNLTDVTAGPFDVRGINLELSASFTFEGEIQKEPIKSVWLIFDSRSLNWQFLSNRELLAIIDQERVTLGEGERGSSVNSSRGRYGRVTLHERLVFELPLETFQRLAKAKAVQLRVGPIEVSLKNEHLKAFSDLLSLRL